MIILIMGVSGSGKTSLGKALAGELGWAFQEGDDFHPSANIEKMKAGIALSDTDRSPWLENIKTWVDARLAQACPAVITCSALKRQYRVQLGLDREAIALVFVHGNTDTLEERLKYRSGHFMSVALLPSQLKILEAPLDEERAIALDIGMATQEQIAAVRRQLGR